MRRILAVFFTLLITSSAWGAIAFDSATDGSSTTGTSHSISFNNAAGNLVVAAVLGDTASDDISGCTWNGSSMTQLDKLTSAQTSNGRYSHFFYILSAATGTRNLVCSAGSSHYIHISAASYSGVSNTGQPDASAKESAAAVNTLTTDVTTVADNSWLILMAFSYLSDQDPGAGTGSTLRAVEATFGTAGIFDSNGPKTPAGSHSMETTRTSGTTIGHIMASFKPDTGGGGGGSTIRGHRVVQ